MIQFIDPKNNQPLQYMAEGLVDSSGAIVYPRVKGVIRAVDESNYTDSFGFQWKKFKSTQIDSDNGTKQSKDRFFIATGWDKEDLSGQSILEVGSGAGRFSQVVLEDTKATLYSVDYSDAVTANFENNGHFGDRFKLFQASVYEMPFAPAQFDKVFCFGVIQHTPDVKATVASLAAMVKPGGELIVDFYPIRGWFTKLHAKYLLRPYTKRMDHKKLLEKIETNIDWMIKASRFFNRIGIGKVVNRFIPIVNINNSYFKQLSPELLRETCVLDTFDMFSPEYDQPQAIATVRSWFEALGFRDIQAGYVTYAGAANLPIVRGIKQ